MNVKDNPTQRILSVSLLFSVLAVSAQAQVNTGANNDSDLALHLEEILVTAQRREESLQEVPISVTALDTAFITDNGIRNVEDLSGMVRHRYPFVALAEPTAAVISLMMNRWLCTTTTCTSVG